MIPRFAEYEIGLLPPLGKIRGTSLDGYAIERNWKVDADPREKLRIAISWLNERIHEFPGIFKLILCSIKS